MSVKTVFLSNTYHSDFMDCLVLEQEAVAEAYMTHLNDSNVSSFHLVNRFSSGPLHSHCRSDVTTTPFHESGCTTRYLSHPDPHLNSAHSSFDPPARVLDKPSFSAVVTPSHSEY